MVVSILSGRACVNPQETTDDITIACCSSCRKFRNADKRTLDSYARTISSISADISATESVCLIACTPRCRRLSPQEFALIFRRVGHNRFPLAISRLCRSCSNSIQICCRYNGRSLAILTINSVRSVLTSCTLVALNTVRKYRQVKCYHDVFMVCLLNSRVQLNRSNLI